MRFRPDPRLYPFESRWLTLDDGSRMHYIDEGSGPVLLLLHGNPSWSFLYRKIVPRLSGRFRCIAPDLPGFGLSTAHPGHGFTAREHADAIVAFIDVLDLRGASVMMQDWGGPIGLRAAQLRPGRIDQLIIGNTFGWPLNRPGPRIFSAVMGGPLGRLGALAINGVVRWFFSAGVVNRLPRDVMKMYLAPFRSRASRQPTYVFPRQLTAAGSLLAEVERDLSAIADKPVLILWGDRDFAFKAHEQNRFRTAFPRHRNITLRGAGHFIQEDAPEAICDAIEAWHDRDITDLPHRPENSSQQS